MGSMLYKKHGVCKRVESSFARVLSFHTFKRFLKRVKIHLQISLLDLFFIFVDLPEGQPYFSIFRMNTLVTLSFWRRVK